MPRFIVKHHILQAGHLSDVELKALSQQSERVLRRLGPDIQWVLSYVTEDRLYSLYFAREEGLIYEHARLAGLPADHIKLVRAIIDPMTGE